MKKSRFSEEQVIGILMLTEAGMKVVEDCRLNGFSPYLFTSGGEKYGGMTVAEARRLQQLEEENSRLKRLVGEQALDIVMLKDVIGKKTSDAHHQETRCAFRSGSTRLF